MPEDEKRFEEIEGLKKSNNIDRLILAEAIARRKNDITEEYIQRTIDERAKQIQVEIEKARGTKFKKKSGTEGKRK